MEHHALVNLQSRTHATNTVQFRREYVDLDLQVGDPDPVSGTDSQLPALARRFSALDRIGGSGQVRMGPKLRLRISWGDRNWAISGSFCSKREVLARIFFSRAGVRESLSLDILGGRPALARMACRERERKPNNWQRNLQDTEYRFLVIIDFNTLRAG